MREAILLFGGDELLPQIRRAMLPLKVYVRPVPPADYSRSIGELADGSGEVTEPYEGPAFSEPMAVLAGFFGNRMDITLAALRRAGIRIARKAVLTPTNRQWTALALYEELGREHEAVQQMRKAHSSREEK